MRAPGKPLVVLVVVTLGVAPAFPKKDWSSCLGERT